MELHGRSIEINEEALDHTLGKDDTIWVYEKPHSGVKYTTIYIINKNNYEDKHCEHSKWGGFDEDIDDCDCGCSFDRCPTCGDKWKCQHCGLCANNSNWFEEDAPEELPAQAKKKTKKE